MGGITIVLLGLVVVVIAASSMRRKGKITPTVQWTLVGIVAVIAVAVAVLEWLGRSGG